MAKEKQQPLTPVSGDQVGEIIRICKANRDAGGPGIGPDVQGFIRRMNEGGVKPGKKDPRHAQAYHLWTLGIKGVLKCASFAEYLASVPQIPEFPDAYFAKFSDLVLVDRDLDLDEYCGLGGFAFADALSNSQRQLSTRFLPYGSVREPVQRKYWMRANLRGFSEKSAHDVRGMIDDVDTALCSVHEGVAAYIQHPSRMKNGYSVFGESVYTDARQCVAAISTFNDAPLLGIRRFDDDRARVIVRGAFIG
ncbi:hypothetical protein HY632_00200 [Candidatus Uhrbacteria bacterium]|nr:hypothetical protein [Candidatus Uhrbacteria bacterium]